MNDAYTRAPHRQPASTRHSPNAALLIDFDNVTMGIRSNLGQELRNFLNSDIIRGKVSVQRAYADWRRYQQYIVPLSEASIDLIFAPAYGSSKKNATDIRLAIDALELVFTRPEIGTYILLSGDSDFSSMVLKLKEYGKYVIGVGLQESSSDLLVQNCDEYYSYNTLSGLTETADLQTVRHDPWELVEQALQRMVERNDVMRSDRLKQVMLEMDSSFDEKEHGFSKFNRFLGEASSRDLVRLRKAENGQYEVRPGKTTEATSGDAGETEAASDGTGSAGGGGRTRSGGGRSRRSTKPKQKSRSSGPSETSREMPPPIETSSLRDAYDLLRSVVRERTRGGEKVRDSEVKRAMLDRDSSFDETSLGFRKFSRFLHQAHDEEVVDVTRDANGNYHISVPDDAGAETSAAQPKATVPEPESPVAEPQSSDVQRQTRAAKPETTAAEPETPAEEPEVPDTAPDAGSAEPGEPVGAETGTPDREKQRSSGRRRGGLGRFRRGSKRGGRSGGNGDSGMPLGPVDASTADEDEGDSEAAETTPATASGGSPAAERQTADAAPSSGQGAPGTRRASDGAAREAEPSADAGEDGDLIRHMVRNYAGVGRKTAEKLVEEFGDSVLEIVDSEPERLGQVLPEHRAQAVVEARRAERA